MINLIKNIGRSILFKLLVVFVVTAIVLVLVVGGIIRNFAEGGPQRQLIGKNLAQYSTYLTNQIGVPPDLELAQILAAKLGIVISIVTSNIEWSSAALPIDSPSTGYRHVFGFPNVQRTRYRGRLFVRVNQPTAQFLLVFGKRGSWDGHNHGEILVLLFLVIGAILTLSYLIVRWLLKPLGWLTRGMKRMGGGDLDTTIPIRKHDELGDLARVFNDMSVKIRNAVRAKQQLLLDVSHELRSPMTRMKLATEFIQDDKVKEQIVSDLHEMEAMTAEILESDRLASEQGGLFCEKADLTTLIKDIVDTYQDQAPGIKILSYDTVTVSVDVERARVLFRNVIDNALKYSKDQTRPVEINISSGIGRVSVIIEDFGEGIPEQDQALLFEPFYRVDKSRQKQTGGYGLGLSLCKKIMDAHGGDITISSRLGQGTRFTIVFPNAG